MKYHIYISINCPEMELDPQSLNWSMHNMIWMHVGLSNPKCHSYLLLLVLQLVFFFSTSLPPLSIVFHLFLMRRWRNKRMPWEECSCLGRSEWYWPMYILSLLVSSNLYRHVHHINIHMFTQWQYRLTVRTTHFSCADRHGSTFEMMNSQEYAKW